MIVVGKLSEAVVVALADGAVRQRFADLGMELFPREQQTPCDLWLLLREATTLHAQSPQQRQPRRRALHTQRHRLP
jgi:hypothetical protein